LHVLQGAIAYAYECIVSDAIKLVLKHLGVTKGTCVFW